MKRLLGILAIVVMIAFAVSQKVTARDPLGACLSSAEASRTTGVIFCGQYSTDSMMLGICLGAVDNAYQSDVWNCYYPY